MKSKLLIDSLSGFVYFFVCVLILKYFVNNFEFSLWHVLLYLLLIGIYALILNNVVSYIIDKYFQWFIIKVGLCSAKCIEAA